MFPTFRHHWYQPNDTDLFRLPVNAISYYCYFLHVVRKYLFNAPSYSTSAGWMTPSGYSWWCVREIIHIWYTQIQTCIFGISKIREIFIESRVYFGKLGANLKTSWSSAFIAWYEMRLLQKAKSTQHRHQKYLLQQLRREIYLIKIRRKRFPANLSKFCWKINDIFCRINFTFTKCHPFLC